MKTRPTVVMTTGTEVFRLPTNDGCDPDDGRRLTLTWRSLWGYLTSWSRIVDVQISSQTWTTTDLIAECFCGSNCLGDCNY